MTALHSVPPRSRMLLGCGLAIPSAALLGAGSVMLARGSGAMLSVVAVLVIACACMLLAISAGLLNSAARDRRRMQAAAAEAELDAAIINSEAYRSLTCGGACAGGSDDADASAVGAHCTIDDCAVRSLPRQ